MASSSSGLAGRISMGLPLEFSRSAGQALAVDRPARGGGRAAARVAGRRRRRRHLDAVGEEAGVARLEAEELGHLADEAEAAAAPLA